MKLVVLGAGAWGTALAISASRHTGAHQVVLCARDAGQLESLQVHRENRRYLAGHLLPTSLQVAKWPSADASGRLQLDADLCVVATPTAALRDILRSLSGFPAPVAWLCKGFEAPQPGAVGLMPHEVQAQVAPHLQAGAFSGPSFAQEVASGLPTALVAASGHAEVRDALVSAFHNPTLRVYGNDDLIGVEVGGAVKNVLAVATGLCDGLALGLNARAALITRGLAEMSRLGMALGARSDTFMGLSGLGDLVLTATGDLSRNRRVGLLLAQGYTLDQAVQSLGHVAEGVYSARTVNQRAISLGVDMPIVQAVVDLLDGRTTAQQALTALMGRGAKSELG